MGAGPFISTRGSRQRAAVIVVVLLAAAGAAPGCSSTSAAFRLATREDTVADYQLFLRQHPQSEFTARANARIDSLRADADWSRASKSGRVEAYQEHVRRYPASPDREAALARIAAAERTEWERAASADSGALYRAYLARWPEGGHVAAARAAMDSLESRQYVDAVSSADPAVIRRFFGDWPGSAHQDELRTLLLRDQTDDHLARMPEYLDAIGRFVAESFANVLARQAAHLAAAPALLVSPEHPLRFGLASPPPAARARDASTTPATPGAAGIAITASRWTSWLSNSDAPVETSVYDATTVRGRPFAAELRWECAVIDSSGHEIAELHAKADTGSGPVPYRQVLPATTAIPVEARFVVNDLRISFERGTLLVSAWDSPPRFAVGTVCRFGSIGRFVRQEQGWERMPS